VSAVWRASRAAVRRRRLQTIVIGVVVGLSTTMIVVALGLLAASSGPFDQAYARQRGAHLVAVFDHTKVSDAQLAQAARRPEVAAVAGPFGLGALDVTIEVGRRPLSLTVVGRGDPGGPVDRLNVWQGRWATKPGEIVLNQNPVGPGPVSLGTQVSIPEGPSLTVVGFAYTVSESAGAWVTPDQMADLHPTTTQLLYRFTHATTDAQISSDQSAVTAGLPPGTLLGSKSYLTLKARAAAEPGTFVPFLVVFGCLGLAVAILIVANVVNGAVVAGLRHIGVLKALGFTPTQVMTVYLAMVSIPAIAGCVLGTGLGNLLATPLLANAFENYGSGNIAVAPWVDAATLLGMPVVVALSALVPALRAQPVGVRGDQRGQRATDRPRPADPALTQRHPAATLGQPRSGLAVRTPGSQCPDHGRRGAGRDKCDVRDRPGEYGDRLPEGREPFRRRPGQGVCASGPRQQRHADVERYGG
jgi:putative ABC transport system permease protein